MYKNIFESLNESIYFDIERDFIEECGCADFEEVKKYITTILEEFMKQFDFKRLKKDFAVLKGSRFESDDPDFIELYVVLSGGIVLDIDVDMSIELDFMRLNGVKSFKNPQELYEYAVETVILVKGLLKLVGNKETSKLVCLDNLIKAIKEPIEIYELLKKFDGRLLFGFDSVLDNVKTDLENVFKIYSPYFNAHIAMLQEEASYTVTNNREGVEGFEYEPDIIINLNNFRVEEHASELTSILNKVKLNRLYSSDYKGEKTIMQRINQGYEVNFKGYDVKENVFSSILIDGENSVVYTPDEKLFYRSIDGIFLVDTRSKKIVII